jgi:drug/metabolite transporter (DMT)-like permease
LAVPRTPLAAALLLLLPAVTILSVGDGFAKHLADIGYSVLQIVWARYVFQTLLVLPLALSRHGRGLLRPPEPWAQIARSLLHMISTFLFFMAIARIPLADAIAIFFAYPFLVTALAPWLLGEKTGWRRWAAVIVGFAGTLFIIKPGMGTLDIGALFPLAGSVAFAFYIVLTRRIATRADPLISIFVQGFVAAALLSLVVALDWRTPDPAAWAMLAAIGAVTAVGHYMTIRAYGHVSASLLAPFGYFEIVAATIIGLFWFDNFPDGWSWVGIAIIVASGVYISLRERARHRPLDLGAPRRETAAGVGEDGHG